ncbi:DUF805 domain-containing protein [Bacteroidales bacterium OttesenSCG-928-J16]|nr:DUF805 domain-containing protein [Bacteroidales bacterium OttesenSCG-928-J16]
MKWYLDVLKKYAVFSGRARRKEYWMFLLFNALICGAISILGLIIGLSGSGAGAIITYVLLGLYSLLIIIPSLAVVVRRLHDVGKSGAMILIVLIPAIGQIWFLILMLTGGQPGANQYGADPKEIKTAE